MDRANLALASYLSERPDLATVVHLAAHRIEKAIARHPRVVSHEVPRPFGSHWLAGPMLDRTGRRLAGALPNARLIVNGGNCLSSRVAANWVHYLHACWAPGGGDHARLPWYRRAKNALAHRHFLRDERIALELAPRIIANSRLTADQIALHYPKVADRVRIVYYGTDAERFGPVSPEERTAAREAIGLTDDRPAVVFVGALGDARKGFDILFEAWKALTKRPDWDARLLVAGSGASLPLHERAARESGLGESIRFLGFRSDIPRILAAADLLVSPVRYEAYGLNVHEALCRGIPVLVSADSGVAERLPDDAESASMKLPQGFGPALLAESLWRWRDNSGAYQETARRTGDHLRAATWNDRMAEFIGEIP